MGTKCSKRKNPPPPYSEAVVEAHEQSYTIPTITETEPQSESLPTANDLKTYATTNNIVTKKAKSVIAKIKKKQFEFFTNLTHILIIQECERNEDELIKELNKLTNNEYTFCVSHYIASNPRKYMLCINTKETNTKK